MCSTGGPSSGQAGWATATSPSAALRCARSTSRSPTTRSSRSRSAWTTSTSIRSERLSGVWPVAAGRRASSSHRGAEIDLDHPQVVVRDDATCARPVQSLSQPFSQRSLPDRPPDGKSDEARHAGLLLQPVLELRLGCPAAEDDANDILAAAASGFLGYPPIILAPIQAFDLPDVRLDTGGLRLHDGANRQLRPHFQVVKVAVPADLLQLGGLRRHQQLEQKSAVMFAQPARQSGQPLKLSPVHSRVAVGVVAHKYFGVGRIESFDVLAKIDSIFEVEFVLTTLLDRHRECVADGTSHPRNLGAELLVNKQSNARSRDAVDNRQVQALEYDSLRVSNQCRFLRGRRALDVEQSTCE